ncbi:retrotransposon protein, putative, ty1-copia subclass [Tanacetum coccineum]
MFVIEQPILPAPAVDSIAQVLADWNAVYDAHNEELKSMFEKQAGVERFDLIQTFHACKQEEGKLVSSYVVKMKGYVEQLDRLGYVLPFVQNYNMHNMGKMIGELHALLIEYEKGKGKGKGKGKDKLGYIPKPKNPKPSAKENPEKDHTCHHYKEVGHWKGNCPIYLAELVKKQKQVGTTSSSVDTSLIHIESRKSPTAELFDVDSKRISIVIVNTKEYHSDVLARSQGYCGFMKKSISANEREVTAGDSAGNALGANHRLSAVSLRCSTLCFIDFEKPNYVYELKKALYGLKQAPKAWLEDSKPTKTPMSTEIKLTKDDEADSVDSTKYRENPETTHLEADKYILRYIRELST